MDIAQLGYSIDSRPLVSGKQRLREFGDEGDRAGRSVGALGASAKRGFGAVAIAATAALGALASVGSAIRTISEFETSMSRLGAISGATTDQLAAMRDVARDLGATTEFSAMQAADGLNFLSMAGFSASESMAAISSVLDLATASGMGLAEAADTASNIMSGFGIAAEDAADVADVLAAAASRANTDVGQLGQAMSTVAPISAALEISLADTAAAIGVLSDAGIQGARAGTAMRGVLASLAGPTTEAVEVLQRLGLTIDDINPETNDLAVVMGRLGDAGLSTADAMKIFGREAASGALVLVDGAKRLGEFGDELERVDGAAGDMADTMRDNLGGDIKALQSAVSGLMIAMGEAGLTAIIRGVVQAITGITRVVSFAVEGIGSLKDAFFGLFDGTSAAQLATDNLTLAMGDEIDQAAKLVRALDDGRIMSVDVAGAKLAQAEAHLAAADAARQDAIAQVQLTEGYQRQQAIIDDNRRILQEYRDLEAQGEVAGQFEAEQIAELNRQLREAVATQKEMVNAVGETSSEYLAIQAEITRLRTGIATAKDGMVSFGDEVVTANELGDRLSGTIDGISFSSSISGAQDLANWLGISLSSAIALSRITSAMSDEDALMAGQVIPDAAAREGQRQALANYNRLTASVTRAARGTSRLSSSSSDAADGLSDAAKASEEFADSLGNQLQSGLEGVVDYMLGGFKDGLSGIVNIFANTLKQMVLMAAKNQIMFSMGIGGFAGAGATALGGMVSGGAAGGILGGLGAFGSGLSVVGNGFLAGGFGGAAQAGMGAISGGLGMGGLSGFATAAGAALPFIAIGAALVSFFGTKTKTLDAGIRATVDMESAMFESFEKIQKSRFWGLSKSTSTNYSELSADKAGPLDVAVSEVRSGVLGAIGNLGLSGDVLDGFSHQFNVSLDGLDEAAQQAAIFEALGDLGDAMAGQIDELDEYQRASEGANDTLQRLSASLVNVNDVFRDLGFSAFNVSLAGADAASQFSDMFGSLENFNSATAAYYDQFYSDEEKLANATGRLTEKLADLGINFVPDTNAAFRELVDTAMLGGDSDLAAQLIQLAPAFDSVTDAANALADSLVAAVNEDAFTDGIDYRRAIARAGNGLEYTPGQREAEMVAELRALNARIDVMQSTNEITAANTGKAADNTEGQLLIAEEGIL